MKKIGIICLMLVLALGAMGVGYATWSQTLTITEEVNTGTFQVGVRDMGTNDDGPALGETWPAGGTVGKLYPENSPTDGTLDPGYTKNVGAAHSEQGVEKFKHEEVQYYHDVTETIVNAYPSYSCNITLQFANGGTVPANGVSLIKTVGTDTAGLAPFVEITGWEIRDDSNAYVDSGVTIADLNTAIQAYQLDPCNIMQLDLNKHIMQWVDANDDQVEDPDEICPQGASVTFTETIKWQQWNVD